MTSFSLPITVRTDQGDVDLLVDLTGPTRLGDVLPELIESAGLAAGTVLHLGVGAVQNSWWLGRPPLLAGCILASRSLDRLPEVGPVNLSCVAGPDAGLWVPLGARDVLIGRSPGCDLRPADPELSRLHARIACTEEGLVIDDLDSVNGIRVDGLARQQDQPSVPIGALIRLGGSVFRASFDAEPAMVVVQDGAGHLLVSRPARVDPPFDHPLPPPVGPPPERIRHPVPVLAAIGGAIAGAAISALTGMWTFLLLAALGPVMMLLAAMSDRIGGRRSHRRAMITHRADLATETERLAEALVADRRDAWDRYPDPATLARRAAGCRARLWERRRGHPDFLVLSLGIGARPARLRLADPPAVTEVPITLDLGAVGVLGITGACRPLVRQLLTQVAALHSPADLHVAIFSEHGDLARCRDLPHAAHDGPPGRSATMAAAEVERLLRHADERMLLVVLDDADRARRIPGMSELLTRAAALDRGVVAVCVSATGAALPVECAAIAAVTGGVVRLSARTQVTDADLAGVTASQLDHMVCALAPLVDPDTPGGVLPGDVVLSELLASDVTPDPLSQKVISERWQHPAVRTVIGVGPGGPVDVDLERDGPHLLIAGTTGSGKSELLQTLIVGLATAAPPGRITFLLIDYKGGAAFGPLTDLPHTTGLITDLDASMAQRALTSLRAEVRRREQLLAVAGQPDLTSLRVAGAAAPSLVVIVDEYATLAAERPEFLTGLLDVAQRGRSLGVHLVLGTQRPAGVLSPAIRANIGLRICLRVADDADSLDVIDTTQAARLPQDLPGRAVLRRSRSDTAVFQVARVSGPGREGHRVRRRDSLPPQTEPRPPGASDLDRTIRAAQLLTAGMRRPDPPWVPPLPWPFQSSEPDVIGLIDRPDEQRRIELLPPPNSMLVLGPAGTGRSSALRRLACAAAVLGADQLVIDPAGGLADLAGWTSTGTYLNGQDPALVQRLVVRVSAELNLRTTSTGPPIVLLVDGWDLISGPLDALDYGATQAAIADLAARGPAVGIKVVMSGNLQLEHHRMTAGFATVLRLGVDDRGEPLAAGGGALARPGRGRLCADEIQMAGCDPDSTPPDGRGRSRRPGRPPIVVRELPTRVDVRSLPAAAPPAVPIGVGGDASLPQIVDLTGPGGGLLVAGPRRSGVSTALSVLAVGAAAAGIRVVRGCPRPVEPLPGVEDIDLRAGTAELTRLLVDHHGPVLLIADDADRWPGEAAELMERFVAVAGSGQYVAVGCRLELAMRAGRGFIAEVAALRCGILLQADSADGGVLDAMLPRRRGAVRPGRGHLVLMGEVTALQVAVL